jgi:signal transduction histidine kinase
MDPCRSTVTLDEGLGTAGALYDFFDTLPPRPDAAFVLALGTGADTDGVTAQALADHASLPVTIVTAATRLEVNRIYLSPPGHALVLRGGTLVPVEATSREAGGAVLHVVRTPARSEQSPGADGNPPGDGPLRLSVHPSPPGDGGANLPLVVIEDGEEPPTRRRRDVAPWGASRAGRLERELRETRRELRDMVQRYESTQRRLRTANEALQEKNDLLEERNEQVRALSRALRSAEANERERLAHVLHDDLQQVLYAARTKVDLVVEQQTVDGRGRRLLGRALELLDDGIDTTRTLASALNPPVEDTLWDTLEWLTIRMQEAHGLSVEMRTEGIDRTTDRGFRRLLVRLVRELLFNVVKHAGTEEAVLRLDETADRLVVVVADEGRGFDPDALTGEGEGFGLASVRRRVELAGGCFEVESAPGEGTRVRLTVPFGRDPD